MTGWLIVASYFAGYVFTVAAWIAALCRSNETYPKNLRNTFSYVFADSRFPVLMLSVIWPVILLLSVIPAVVWLMVRRTSLTAQGIDKLNRKAA